MRFHSVLCHRSVFNFRSVTGAFSLLGMSQERFHCVNATAAFSLLGLSQERFHCVNATGAFPLLGMSQERFHCVNATGAFSLCGMSQVGWGCVGWGDSSIRDTPTDLIEVTVLDVPEHLRYRRSVDLPPPRPHPRHRPDSAIAISAGPDGQGPQPERPLVATFTENDAARRQPVSPQRAPDDQGPQPRQEAEVRGPSKHRARRESSGQNMCVCVMLNLL